MVAVTLSTKLGSDLASAIIGVTVHPGATALIRHPVAKTRHLVLHREEEPGQDRSFGCRIVGVTGFAEDSGGRPHQHDVSPAGVRCVTEEGRHRVEGDREVGGDRGLPPLRMRSPRWSRPGTARPRRWPRRHGARRARPPPRRPTSRPRAGDEGRPAAPPHRPRPASSCAPDREVWRCTATRAPSAAKARTTAVPIPPAPPVTSTP